MPKLEIDYKPLEVPAGTNLIEAAKLLNIEIPHYCYHPGLTVVGSCRMCQIEVEVNGRKAVAIGCNTICTDGMKVYTNTATVHKLRSSVLEFYLQHHPLDCPICDDAGECDLQNYYQKYGLHDSRVELGEKLHKHKVHDVGPTVVLDSERCVLCSRCVRFCREVAGTDELGIFGVGGNAELMNVPGKKLDNDYAGNVVDLCPVGALTDKDFRFKRRVWYLKRESSICTGCSRGCNIFVDWDVERKHNDPERRIQRLKPRYNRLVNEWWMCDRGRYSYHSVDAPNRLLAPLTKAERNGHALTVAEVIERAAGKISAVLAKHGPKSIAVLGSANSTNEDLFVLKKLFVDELKITTIDVQLAKEEQGKADEILMKSDLSPNRRGALELGLRPCASGQSEGDEILAGAVEGEFELLIVVNHDLSKMLSAKELVKLDQNCGYILYLSTHTNAFCDIADDVIPLAMWAERTGSYTNFQGRVQKTAKCFAPHGLAVTETEIWSELSKALGKLSIAQEVSDIFAEISEQVPSFKGLTWEGLGKSGQLLAGVPDTAHRKVRTKSPLPAY